MSDFRLLTDGESNPKTAKLARELGVRVMILHLAPHASAGAGNVCPWAAKNGCAKTCLAFQGRGKMASVFEARARKTRAYFEDRAGFMEDLRHDLRVLERRARKAGQRAAVRLDGTSDLGLAFQLAPEFPGVQFYDYTKGIARARRLARAHARGELLNLHLTFSAGAGNLDEVIEALDLGFHVATPFALRKGEALPETWFGRPVFDADEHDLRFLDPRGRGMVAGLRAKGTSARDDEAGFIVRVA